MGQSPQRDPAWATGDECASNSVAWLPLQTDGCTTAIAPSHLDDASSPRRLTVTRRGASYHQNQLSHPPGSKGLHIADWQAFNFPLLIPLLCFASLCFSPLYFHRGRRFCVCSHFRVDGRHLWSLSTGPLASISTLHRKQSWGRKQATAVPAFTPCLLLLLPLISSGRNTDLICEDNNPLDFGD